MLDLSEPESAFGTSRPRELAMSAAWNAGFSRVLLTTSGASVEVIHPGTWSHGFGPDFVNAMFTIDGQYAKGAVEIHNRSSDWYGHGHHLDPAYDDVALHVVSADDQPETRTVGGRIVPNAVLQIPDAALFAIDRRLPDMWNELGGTVCAPDLSTARPDIVRRVIHRLGDERLDARIPQLAAELAESSADAVLTRRVFDALGYSENRGAMRQLADLIERYGIRERLAGSIVAELSPELAGTFLELGGFLPLSPTDAHAGGILPSDQYLLERAWARCGASFAADSIPATAWQMGRVRPANHPVYRILQGAMLLASTGGAPADHLLNAMRAGEPPVTWIQDMTRRPGHPGFGVGRATAAAASALIPFALAIARETRDADLEDAAQSAWIALRQAEWTRPAKRALTQVTGGPPIRKLNERGHQGLLRLDAEYCSPRRCFQCPIAAEVVRAELSAG